jgi:hypothetical protein
MLVGVVNELPLVPEGAVVAAAEMVQDDPSGWANARRLLQEFHEILRQQAAR